MDGDQWARIIVFNSRPVMSDGTLCFLACHASSGLALDAVRGADRRRPGTAPNLSESNHFSVCSRTVSVAVEIGRAGGVCVFSPFPVTTPFHNDDLRVRSTSRARSR
jgi:hypothetical protein